MLIRRWLVHLKTGETFPYAIDAESKRLVPCLNIDQTWLHDNARHIHTGFDSKEDATKFYETMKAKKRSK